MTKHTAAIETLRIARQRLEQDLEDAKAELKLWHTAKRRLDDIARDLRECDEAIALLKQPTKKKEKR
jgi:hypothetical protein